MSGWRPVTISSFLLVFAFDALGNDSTALIESAAQAGPPPKAEHVYPDPDWKTESPAKHGLTADGLANMAAVAERFDSSCLMVIHDGVLVGEWYWDGFDRSTDVANAFSVTKSITSTLVGIAQDSKLLSVDQPASTYITSWVGTPGETVTIANLISNNSGRFWSFESDYVSGLLVVPDQTSYAIGLAQQFDPGTVWEYNNSAIQTLEPLLEQSVGQSPAVFARAKLFDRIGMTAQLNPDPSGNTMVYQGVSASCDDLARFGYLALREGQWKGEQIVSKEWMQQATSPSTDLNIAYGYMWWLNRSGHVVLPSWPTRNEFDGQLVPAASEDVYFAVGAFGQFVMVDPKSGYVVVRLQNVTDLNAALAISPDPTGIVPIREIVTAFEGAKKKKGK